MLNKEQMVKIQNQATLTINQLANMRQYVLDNCRDEMWKDVLLSEMESARMRLEIINRESRDLLVDTKAS
jgi:hypothetical protein